MIDKVLVITAPDDILEDGPRLLLVDLTQDQLKIISTILSLIDSSQTFITYIWKNGQDIEWLLDKKIKSDHIIFNADSDNQTLIGYLSSGKNSSYFGILRSLERVNKSAILSLEDCNIIIEKVIEKYE
jgi:hypothetical protein